MITMPQEKSLSACCTIEDGKDNLVEDGCLSPLQARIRQLINLLVFFQWFECFCIILCGE